MDGTYRVYGTTTTATLVGRWLARVVVLAVAAALVGLWAVYLRPTALGGPATYVIVSGTSMEPTFRSHDFVLAFRQPSYAVGDIVVYRIPGAQPGSGTNIVHRIVGGSPKRGFVIRGDNKDTPDFWRPTPDRIEGKVRLHVPFAGRGLILLRSPFGLALIAGLTTMLLAIASAPGRDRATAA